MNKSTNIIVAAVVVGIAIVAAWFLLLFQPASSQIGETRVKIDESVQHQDELKAQIATLKKMAANQDAITQGNARMNEAVPATPSLTEFIRQANLAASSNGVDWVSVTPSEPAAAEGGLQVVSMQMQVSGPFDRISNFLQALIGSLPDAQGKPYVSRVFTIDTLNLSGGGDATANGSPQLTAQITGRIFLQPAPSNAANAAAAPPAGATAPPAAAK